MVSRRHGTVADGVQGSSRRSSALWTRDCTSALVGNRCGNPDSLAAWNESGLCLSVGKH